MSTMQQSVGSAATAISPTAAERVSVNSSKIEQAKLALKLNPTASAAGQNSSQTKSYTAQNEKEEDPLKAM